MFGKRTSDAASPRRVPQDPAAPVAPASVAAESKAVMVKAPTAPVAKAPNAPAADEQQRRHSEEYYDVKTTVFNALIDTIDLTQLAKLDTNSAREEIRDIVSENDLRPFLPPLRGRVLG